MVFVVLVVLVVLVILVVLVVLVVPLVVVVFKVIVVGCLKWSPKLSCHNSETLKTIHGFRIIWETIATIPNLATNQHPTLAQISCLNHWRFGIQTTNTSGTVPMNCIGAWPKLLYCWKSRRVSFLARDTWDHLYGGVHKPWPILDTLQKNRKVLAGERR